MAIVKPEEKTKEQLAQMLLNDIQNHTARYYCIAEGLMSKDKWPDSEKKIAPHSYFGAAGMLDIDTNDQDVASIHQDWKWGGKQDEFTAFIHTYCMDIITNHTREPGWWDFEKDLPIVDYDQLRAYWPNFHAWWRDPNWDGSGYPSVPHIEVTSQVHSLYTQQSVKQRPIVSQTQKEEGGTQPPSSFLLGD